MSKLIITGSKKLKGNIRISGNKNSVLPIFAACLLTNQKCIIKNVPDIGDKDAMIDIMRDIGVDIKKINKHCYQIQAKKLNNADVYNISNNSIRGTNIFLGEQSVTATENAILLAVLAKGKSIIENAAAEPHVQDLTNFLNKMGAKITGMGTNTIKIIGVKKLRGAIHTLRSDYVEAISFACLAAATKNHLKLTNIISDDLKMALHIFDKMGINYKCTATSLEIFPSTIYAVEKIQDGLWPALSPDAISPFVVLATQAKGNTLIQQWMFEGRLFFVDKLILMGADITLCDPHRVIITGPVKLLGKKVLSPDLRAGITLLIAALMAKGVTEIDNAYQIDRGYENIVERLQKIGADIIRK